MKFEHTHRIDATPATIFAHYADVPSWPRWDEDLDAATLAGPFASGSTGRVKPKSGPASEIRFVDVQPGRSFAAQCTLPLCVMRFEYELRPCDAPARQPCTLATHRVLFSGALAWLFGRLIGPGMRKSLPGSMRRLEQLALAHG
jgi:hypothetical protein